MPGPFSYDAPQIVNAKYKERKPRPGITTKRTMCSTCDMYCSVVTESKNGRVVRVRSSDNPIFRDNICMKAIVAPKGYANPNRIMHPLKRMGERGSGKWERVTWEEAYADIGARLKKIIADHGPEAWGVSSSAWNLGTDHGLDRRVMNHISNEAASVEPRVV